MHLTLIHRIFIGIKKLGQNWSVVRGVQVKKKAQVNASPPLFLNAF
jgi:hypothetical protein